MNLRMLVPVVAVAALAACAPPAGIGLGGVAAADPATCVAMFEEFDRRLRLYPVPRRENRLAAPEVMAQGELLLEAGCITRDRDLAGAEALPPAPITAGGPPIAPIALHAGVVQSDATDARMRAFFEARGVRARSVGHPALGRRIYLGPFATQGGLDAAAALARDAGFIAPYPAQF